MKQLMVVTVCAAFISLGSSAGGQAPMSPGGALAPRVAPAQPSATQSPSINMPQAGPGPTQSSEADELATPRRAKTHRRAAGPPRHTRRPGGSPADHMANQLNRQELERLPPPAAVTPAGAVPPRPPAR